MADVHDHVGMHFALRPGSCDPGLLVGQEQSKIAEEIQPQLLMYRLRNFEAVRSFPSEAQGATLLGGEIGRSLRASVLGEVEIMQMITPTLQSSDQEKIADFDCDVHHALVEAIWAPSHQDRQIMVSRLTELVNALLRTRGELLEHSPMEIGWKLRGLGFDRQRNGEGMFLRFSMENRVLLHRRAKDWGLDSKTFAGCDLCSPRPNIR